MDHSPTSRGRIFLSLFLLWLCSLSVCDALWYVDYLSPGKDPSTCVAYAPQYVRAFRTGVCISSNHGTSLMASCSRSSSQRTLNFYSDEDCRYPVRTITTTMSSGCGTMFCTNDYDSVIPRSHGAWTVNKYSKSSWCSTSSTYFHAVEAFAEGTCINGYNGQNLQLYIAYPYVYVYNYMSPYTCSSNAYSGSYTAFSSSSSSCVSNSAYNTVLEAFAFTYYSSNFRALSSFDYYVSTTRLTQTSPRTSSSSSQYTSESQYYYVDYFDASLSSATLSAQDSSSTLCSSFTPRYMRALRTHTCVSGANGYSFLATCSPFSDDRMLRVYSDSVCSSSAYVAAYVTAMQSSDCAKYCTSYWDADMPKNNWVVSKYYYTSTYCSSSTISSKTTPVAVEGYRNGSCFADVNTRGASGSVSFPVYTLYSSQSCAGYYYNWYSFISSYVTSLCVSNTGGGFKNFYGTYYAQYLSSLSYNLLNNVSLYNPSYSYYDDDFYSSSSSSSMSGGTIGTIVSTVFFGFFAIFGAIVKYTQRQNRISPSGSGPAPQFTNGNNGANNGWNAAPSAPPAVPIAPLAPVYVNNGSTAATASMPVPSANYGFAPTPVVSATPVYAHTMGAGTPVTAYATPVPTYAPTQPQAPPVNQVPYAPLTTLSAVAVGTVVSTQAPTQNNNNNNNNGNYNNANLNSYASAYPAVAAPPQSVVQPNHGNNNTRSAPSGAPVVSAAVPAVSTPAAPQGYAMVESSNNELFGGYHPTSTSFA